MNIQTTAEELVTRLKRPATRDAAFRELVHRHGPTLRAHLLRMLPQRADVDDVLQNTFVKAYRGIDKFREESALGTWLYRISTNEALYYLRQRQKKSFLPLASTGLGQATAEPYLEADDIRARLLAALRTLAPKQRAVFSMRYFDELSYREIAEVTGTSEGSLKASYHHAAKKIEAYLKSTTDG